MTGSGLTPRGAPHRKGLRNTRARTRAHAHTHMCTHTRTYACMHSCAHTCACTHVCALVHVRTRVCTRANGTDMRKRGREGPSEEPITEDSLGRGVQRNLGRNDQGPCRKRRRVSVQHTCRLRARRHVSLTRSDAAASPSWTTRRNDSGTLGQGLSRQEHPPSHGRPPGVPAAPTGRPNRSRHPCRRQTPRAGDMRPSPPISGTGQQGERARGRFCPRAPLLTQEIAQAPCEGGGLGKPLLLGGGQGEGPVSAPREVRTEP